MWLLKKQMKISGNFTCKQMIQEIDYQESTTWRKDTPKPTLQNKLTIIWRCWLKDTWSSIVDV